MLNGLRLPSFVILPGERLLYERGLFRNKDEQGLRVSGRPDDLILGISLDR